MSSSWLFLASVALWVAVAVAIPPQREQEAHVRIAKVTTTTTATVTVPTTIFSPTPTSTVCAKYVNASTACRRRKNLWDQRPILLSLDDDDDIFNQRQFKPSPVLWVQPTAVPAQRPAYYQPNFDYNPNFVYNPNLVYDPNFGYNPEQHLAPSLYGLEGEAHETLVRSPIFGFLPNLVNALVSVIKTRVVTVTTVVTSPVTLFTPSITSTKTVIISGCSYSVSFNTC